MAGGVTRIMQPTRAGWEVGAGGQCHADLLEIRNESRAPHGSWTAHQAGVRFSGADRTGPCYSVRPEKKPLSWKPLDETLVLQG